MVLNHWSHIEVPPEDPPSSASPTESAKTSPGPKSKDLNYVLRPLWQRSSVAGAYVTFAICAGVISFSARARCINRLHIILPSKSTAGTDTAKSRMLFFQSCNDRPTRGHVIPLRSCKITLAASNNSPVFLEAKGIRGAFRIYTVDARINGQVVPPCQIFAHLAKRGIPSQKLKSKK